MYYIVPPQAFVPRRLTNHLLRKHVPSCIPVDLWEKQRLQEYKSLPIHSRLGLDW